jgi:hypothetical protein
MLRDAAPGGSRIALPWDATVGAFSLPESVEAVARSLKIKVLPLEVHGPADSEAAMAAATKERVNGLLVAATPMFNQHSKRLADLLTKTRVPGISQVHSRHQPQDRQGPRPDYSAVAPAAGRIR